MTIRTLSATASAIGLLLGLVLTAQADGPAQAPAKVADVARTAPEITGIAHWLNSAPLKLTDLRGKVVLVDFWTYGASIA
jgi:hypothetical protein